MEIRKARLVLSFFLLSSIPLRAAEITKAEEQKAAKDVSNEADQWVASQPVVTPMPAVPGTTQTAPAPTGSETAAEPTDPVKTPTAEAAAAITTKSPVAAVSPQTTPAKSPYNEMTGKILEISQDPDVLRITLENGYNVEFSYDKNTIMTNGGGHITIDDLAYGDEVQIHYLGKELRAVDLERIRKAPRPALGQ